MSVSSSIKSPNEPNQAVGKTKLTWRYIAEPTPAQIAAAKENNSVSTGNEASGAAAGPAAGGAGSLGTNSVPISSQPKLGPIVSGTP